jgi:hypothetical protein
MAEELTRHCIWARVWWKRMCVIRLCRIEKCMNLLNFFFTKRRQVWKPDLRGFSSFHLKAEFFLKCWFSFSWSRNSLLFVESGGSFPRIQKPPLDYILNRRAVSHPACLRSVSVLSFFLRPRLPIIPLFQFCRFKLYAQFLLLPCMLHAAPISSVLISSPSRNERGHTETCCSVSSRDAWV